MGRSASSSSRVNAGQWRWGAFIIACLLQTGCASFGPPSTELAAQLREHAPPPAPARQRALVEVEGERFAGTFDAVLIWDGTRSSARLQLLPEVGGKVLDLAITPARIVGYLPPAGIALEHALAGPQPPPRHVLTFIAASVLEVGTPITPERVLGERASEGGRELSLRPVFPGLELHARVDLQGRLVSRAYRLRGVRWQERIGPGQRIFEARGVRWILSERPVEAIAAPPAALFELELPEGLRSSPEAPAEPSSR